MVTRAVVVGFGSAGRRHVAMLGSVVPGIRITVVRRAGAVGVDTGATPSVRFTDDLDDALDEGADIGIVASPAPFHVDAACRLMDVGAATLIEKPVAAGVEDATRLLDRPGSGGAALVGYHLRFADVAPEMARHVAGGTIGAPTAFHFEVGQHLGSWRPDADARCTVSARHELGGGVLTELSHELDAVRFVLGSEVERVDSSELGRDGAPTDGIVETVADLELTCDDGLAGSVHLDMTSRPAMRRWRVEGERGTLTADLLACRIDLSDDQGTRAVASFPPGERDRAEERLIRHLVELARGRTAPRCTVEDGLAALRIVDAARAAASTGSAATVAGSPGRSR